MCASTAKLVTLSLFFNVAVFAATNIIVQGSLNRTVTSVDYGYGGDYSHPVTNFAYHAEVHAWLSNNPAIFDVTRSADLAFRPSLGQATNHIKGVICIYADSQGYNTNNLRFTFSRVRVP